MNYIIETQNLTKCYGEHAAVRDVSLHVPQGAIYGLLGRNGAGKTTVMKMLLGLARPTSGSILLFGRPVKGFARDIYSRIGSSIEAPGFYPHMTAKENLTIFSRLTGKPDPSRIEQALDMVGLSSDSQKTFSQYSLGMKQRLAFRPGPPNLRFHPSLRPPREGLCPGHLQPHRKQYRSSRLLSPHDGKGKSHHLLPSDREAGSVPDRAGP